MSVSEISQHVVFRYVPWVERTRPGTRLREFREGEGLSLARLADLVRPKTTASNIHKLEKGDVELTMEWARRLGDALGRHPLDFFDAQPKLPARESELIERFRGMSEEDRQAFSRIADAMTQRPKKAS